MLARIEKSVILGYMVNEKESKMSTLNNTDFAMFTDAGNIAVANIVGAAHIRNLSWDAVDEMLQTLATLPGFEEATDTAVREAVYVACGFDA